MTRELLYFEIFHEPMDQKGLYEIFDAEELYKEQLTTTKPFYDEMWGRINKELDNIEFGQYKTIRIYQDSLPYIKSEVGTTKSFYGQIYLISPQNWKNLRELEKSGSRNAKAVLSLVKKGAVLEGTESLYYLQNKAKCDLSTISHALTAKKGNSEVNFNADTSKRDKYVARRIGDSLKRGEFGVAFFGDDHKVHDYLPNDIDVRRSEPSAKEDELRRALKIRA